MKKLKKKVAIIGAGFGGISAAKILAKSSLLDIQIIDRRNHHLFQPLLYQVAMAGLNPSEIAVPIRKLFSKNKNVLISLAEVEDIDLKNCSIYFDNKWHVYDYLILATGAKHFYFGKNEWEQLAPGLKNIEQATEIRRRILTAFEMAEKEADPVLQSSYLTFVVIGGGPTGVELAGAISEMAKNTLKDDYKRADLSKTKVYLVESGARILAAFPEKLSLRAEKDLKEMGVSVLKNTRASELSTDGLRAGDEWIKSKTLIWAAGVKPSSLVERLEAEKDSSGRLIVQKDLSIKENRYIFAIGDIANFPTSDGRGLPGIAPVAIQEGQFVGKLIVDELTGERRKEFSYWDKGIMATIGRSRAVVSASRLQLSGFLAWVIWVFIHVLYLMRFKNRVFVFLQWVWAYFSFGRGARLIVHKTWRFYEGKKINYGNEDK
ncbi:MAG: NAD(P)/FAD-dependent oxidoreductase [Oligoflexia bacterium]|nr:NAD(P)/FAD-dependent oxidoreductase [Oligoflexia bacterium]